MKVSSNIDWNNFLNREKKLSYFMRIMSFLKSRSNSGAKIYPPEKDLFNAFLYTNLRKVKIVILGQDPYHSYGQAHGLSFSVRFGVPVPPSLKNIYREIKNNFPNFIIPKHGYLKSWARQGVLLLNSILTVEDGKSLSHSKIGWEIFTDRAISFLSFNKKGIIFLLWGEKAKEKISKIKNIKDQYILTSSHPSPFSANKGFFGCNHFLQSNKILIKNGKTPIDWQL